MAGRRRNPPPICPRSSLVPGRRCRVTRTAIMSGGRRDAIAAAALPRAGPHAGGSVPGSPCCSPLRSRVRSPLAMQPPPATGRRGSAKTASDAARPEHERHRFDAPRIVFLGDSLTAGLDWLASEAYPAMLGGTPRSRRPRFRDRERGRLWRHIGRRLAPPRLVAAGQRERADHRARRKRRACEGCRSKSCAQNLAAIIERAQRRGHPCAAGGHGSAAELRRRATPTASVRSIADLARSTTWRSCRSSSTASPASRRSTRRDGIHPTAAGQQIIADRMLRPLLKPLVEPATSMIELAGCLETVMSGSTPLTILHPLDLTIAGGPVGRRSRGRRAAASPRCSASSPGLDAPTAGRS